MRGLNARNQMWDYIDPLIKERSVVPGEDLLSALHGRDCWKQNDFRRDKRIRSSASRAGGDTTEKAIANMWYTSCTQDLTKWI